MTAVRVADDRGTVVDAALRAAAGEVRRQPRRAAFHFGRKP